jgi:hypothetical protein
MQVFSIIAIDSFLASRAHFHLMRSLNQPLSTPAHRPRSGFLTVSWSPRRRLVGILPRQMSLNTALDPGTENCGRAFAYPASPTK